MQTDTCKLGVAPRAGLAPRRNRTTVCRPTDTCKQETHERLGLAVTGIEQRYADRHLQEGCLSRLWWGFHESNNGMQTDTCKISISSGVLPLVVAESNNGMQTDTCKTVGKVRRSRLTAESNNGMQTDTCKLDQWIVDRHGDRARSDICQLQKCLSYTNRTRREFTVVY